MRDLATPVFQLTRYVIEVNFYFALAILIFGSAVSVSDSYTLFDFNTDIYGELGNNLRIMMVYLAFTEALIFGYCFITNQNQYYFLVGFFLIIMVGSLAFYGEVNNVEIDPNLDVFFFYTGISHILFGGLSMVKPMSKSQH